MHERTQYYVAAQAISQKMRAQRIWEQKWVGERRIRCHTTQSILHPYTPIALSFLLFTPPTQQPQARPHATHDDPTPRYADQKETLTLILTLTANYSGLTGRNHG